MNEHTQQLFFILDGYKDMYTDKDLEKTTPYDYSYAYVFTKDDVQELIKRHGEKINIITNEDKVKTDFYNVISFEDYNICIDDDIKEDFNEGGITEYDSERIPSLINMLLNVKRNYNDLVFAIEDELKPKKQ